MKRLLCLLVVCAIVAGGLVLYRRPVTSAATAQTAAPAPLSVSVEPVRVEPIADTIVSYGNLVSSRTVNIGPQSPGQVTEILFKDGQEVSAGEPLARMDSIIAQAELQSARTQLQTDIENLQRTEVLTRQGVNSIDALQAAEARVAASQSAVNVDQRKLDQLTLTAPFAGRVGRHQVDVGAFIPGGHTIVRLEDPERLQIEFRMPGSVALQVSNGTPVQVQVPASNLSLDGALSFIDPAISTDTRSVLLRAVVRHPGPDVRPGLYVRVSLDLGEHPHALVVPPEAIITDLAASYVFVIGKDDIAHQRTVTLGLGSANRVELLSGVQAGDQVVTVGQFRLRDGDTVKVVPMTATARE